MGLSCNILRNNKGSVLDVLSPTGASSQLFKEIKKYLSRNTEISLRNKSKSKNSYEIGEKENIVKADIVNSDLGNIQIVEIGNLSEKTARNIEDLLTYTNRYKKSVYIVLDSENFSETNKFFKDLGFNSLPLRNNILVYKGGETPLTQEQERNALRLYAVAYSEDFKEFYGDWRSKGHREPTLNEILNYLKKHRLDKEGISDKEMIDLYNNIIGLELGSISELYSVLKDNFFEKGVFTLSEKRLRDSGLFNDIEIRNILGNSLVQRDFKRLSERLEGIVNSENFKDIEKNEVFDNDFVLQDFTSVLGLGKFNTKNPFIVDKELALELAGIRDFELFKNTLIQKGDEVIVEKALEDSAFLDKLYKRYKDLNPVYQYEFKDGDLVPSEERNTFDTLRETFIVGREFRLLEDDIDFVKSIPNEVWDEDVIPILKDIERRLISFNVNIIGISKKYHSRDNIINLLEATEKIIQSSKDFSVNAEELRAYSEEIDLFFGRENKQIVKPQIVSEHLKSSTLFEIHNPKSEEEMFEKHSLLKVGENMYRKISKLSNEQLVESLYNSILNNKNLIPENSIKSVYNSKTKEFDRKKILNTNNKQDILSDISDFLSEKILEYKSDTEYVSEDLFNIVGHKVLLGVPLNETTSLDMNDMGVIRFEGDFSYLTNNFISDFQSYILKEKYKDSLLYQEVLSNFDIGSQGVKIIDNDPITISKMKFLIPNVSIFDNLKQYSYLRRDKNLSKLFENNEEQEFLLDDTQIKRTFYANYPNSLPLFKGDYIFREDEIRTDNVSSDFIRTKEGVFEKYVDLSGNIVYSKLPTIDNTENLYEVPLLNFIEANEKAQFISQTTSVSRLEADSKGVKNKVSEIKCF